MPYEWETNIEVRKEGSFSKSGLDVVDEAYIYKGNENTLIMTQAYTHKFQCQYNFENYPFDTQVRKDNLGDPNLREPI